MPQFKILVDTNSYIRLERTIHPLLFQTFGAAEYCLYVLPELNKELENHKLQSKFHWVVEAEYAENRQYFPKLSCKQKNAIALSYDYVWDYVKSEHPGPSRVDVLYIAYALELGIPVVTDDKDMTELAKIFDAEVMPTLTLLRTMLDCKHVRMQTITGRFSHWRHITDLPANFATDLRRLFPEL